MSWPLQTAFARSTVSFITGRGGIGGALFPGFHALAGPGHHRDPWRLQHREWKQQPQQPGLRIDNRNNVGPRRLVVRCLNRYADWTVVLESTMHVVG